MKAYAVPFIIFLLGTLTAALNEYWAAGALTHADMLTAYFIGALTLGGVVATMRIPK